MLLELEDLDQQECEECGAFTTIKRNRRICNACILRRKRNKKIGVECSNCHKHSVIGYYAYNKNIKNNKVYKCNLCLSKEKNSGENCHLFKHAKNDLFFNKIDSEIKAYLIGIIAGDGNLHKNQISIYAHLNDIETLELAKKFICETTTISKRIDAKCGVIRFQSKQMMADLCKHLGVEPGKKSDKILMPELDDNLVWHFLRGIIDTDGWISGTQTKSTSPQCGIGLTSFRMIDSIKTLCDKYNIRYGFHIRQPKKETHLPFYVLKFNGSNAIIFLTKIYANSNFYLKRKYELFEKWQYWKPGYGIIENKTNLVKKIEMQLPIGKSKLSIDDVRKIRTLYALGNMSYIKLAKLFNVNKNTIFKIIKKQTFKHIK